VLCICLRDVRAVGFVVEGIRADGPDVVWVEHDGESAVSYVRGIRGEPRDFLRTRDVLTWSVRSPAWHWSAVDVDYANKKLYLADKADRFNGLLLTSTRQDCTKALATGS